MEAPSRYRPFHAGRVSTEAFLYVMEHTSRGGTHHRRWSGTRNQSNDGVLTPGTQTANMLCVATRWGQRTGRHHMFVIKLGPG